MILEVAVTEFERYIVGPASKSCPGDGNSLWNHRLWYQPGSIQEIETMPVIWKGKIQYKIYELAKGQLPLAGKNP